MGSFNERIDELIESVGSGNLEMRAVVHQPYAAAEHNKTYKHPRGGGPGYLELPFMENHGEMLEILADTVLDGTLRDGAIRAVQKFEDWVQEHAPVRADVLRNSVNLYVTDNGSDFYEKPQEAPYESWKE